MCASKRSTSVTAYVHAHRTGLILCVHVRQGRVLLCQYIVIGQDCVYVHAREGRRRSNSVYVSSACDICMHLHTSAASLSRSTENLANIIQINFLMQIQAYAYLF